MHQTRENGWGASTDNNGNSKEIVTRQKVNEHNNFRYIKTASQREVVFFSYYFYN